MTRLVALVLGAATVLAGCTLTSPYQALRGQTDAQLRIDQKACWDAPSAGELASIFLIGVSTKSAAERLHNQRLCMSERGYCSTRTYEEGYWTRDSKDNFTWHEPVSARGGFCKTAN